MQQSPSWSSIRTTAAATGRLPAPASAGQSGRSPAQQGTPLCPTCFVPVSAATALLAASPSTDYPVLCRTTDNGSDWETLSDGMSGVSGLPKGTWGDLSFVNDSEGWAAVIIQNCPSQQQHHRQQRGPAGTLDGGKTWSNQSHNWSLAALAVGILQADRILVIGNWPLKKILPLDVGKLLLATYCQSSLSSSDGARRAEPDPVLAPWN